MDPAAREYILNTIINNYPPNFYCFDFYPLDFDIEPTDEIVLFPKDGKVNPFENRFISSMSQVESTNSTFRQKFKA